MSYIGRLAPSPTGLLHLGHVRTFARAAERARAAGGSLLLRIDDLDPGRSRAGYAAAAEEDLQWLRLRWDGEPWLQSRRYPAYRAAWEALIAGGHLYPCRCSRRDLLEAAAAPHESSARTGEGTLRHGTGQNAEADAEPLYPGTCRPAWLPGEAAGSGDRERWLADGPDGVSWRFRVPADRDIAWPDGGFGPRRFRAGQQFGDFAVWRRDGVPAYQLATVADEAAMGITEVVRGADLLLSTARQLLLYQALGLPAPAFFHCPLGLDERGGRLAKRADALSIRALRERGLSPAEVLRMAGDSRLG